MTEPQLFGALTAGQMRITTVIGCLAGGGAERVCVNLANAWVARGRQVTLLTVQQHSIPSAYDIDRRVERCDVGWPRWARSEELNARSIAPVVRCIQQADCTGLFEHITLIAMLRHAILATAPDVVVAHIDMTNVRVLAALHETGVPVIAYEHTDPTQISLGRWNRTRTVLYRRAHAIVAPNPTAAECFKRGGAAAIAIPNPLVTPPSISAGRGLGSRRLVSMSRLSTEKRVALVIRAFASVAHRFPEWDLDIYGTGPLLSELARLAEKIAPGRIRFCGFTDRPYDLLREADLFVSTSWVEGFGNSIWEALACGLPVVATECGAAVRSLVRHGIDGLIVHGSANGLATALASLMGDEQKRNAFAARAPEVLTRFSMESSLQAWDRLLESAKSQPKS
jgi:GalNAc-alpha-(1->4)-GalNAc-alpha-(1->3)-diNAcBac-PP-undecaprenol alpha-1,4-N-acetyl-D-galactosaminyltransferase